ncbi:MAG TPA: S8 family serine peptidase, partial [Gammaproteobacteria bacterium]
MTNRYSLSAVFCFLLLTAVFSDAYAATGAQPVTHRIIVKFKAGPTPSAARDKRHGQILRLGNNLPLRHLRTLGDLSSVYSLGRFQKLDEVKAVAAELMRRDDVEYVEPDLRRYPQFVPNDADYSNQWYLHETAGGINAEPAWDITFGNSSVVIALIDSGILPHNDLVRVLPGYDFIAEDPPPEPDLYFTANDGDGRDEDPSDPGDAVPEDRCDPAGSPAENSTWHGTKLAGIVAAETNNNSGLAGIDQQAWVLPVRALGRCGGYLSDIADAIRWAAGLSVPGVPDNPTPADVINLSLGAAGVCSHTEQQAIDAAVANGTVVVVAAGNEGGFISDSAPANCENVITVTATTRQGAETCYTNIGTGADLAAPGGNSQEDFCTAFPDDQIYML